MKPRNSPSFGTSASYALRFALAAALSSTAYSADSAWEGLGSDGNWSTAANWDFVPVDGDSLIFDGSARLANTNDIITLLDGTAFNFPATAGSFVISDGGAGTVTIGTTAGNNVLATVDSTAPQEIALNLQLAGGNKARSINLAAGSKLTLSGNIDSSNSWLFPDVGAGTIELTGNNTGPGNGLHTAGTNNMRGFCRLNASGQTIALGSPTALGDANVDFANLRGLRMNTGSQVLTTVGGMDLVGENMVNSTISWNESTSYVGAGDLEVGGLIYTKNNGRAWTVDGGGEFIVSGHGVILTTRAEAQTMILQPLNGNVITVNGPVHDTFQSEGIVTQLAGFGSVLTDGVLRLQGSGTINLNADNSATMNAEVLLNSATITVKLGDANALGTSGAPFDEVTTISVDKVSNTYSAPGDLPNEIEVTDTTGIEIGFLVTGPGIPAGAVVTAIDSGINVVTIDMDATADGLDVTLTFSGSTTETVTPGRTNMNAGVLDLNGFAVNETFVNLGTSHRFINSNTDTPAQVLADIVGQGYLRVDGPGDIVFNNVYHPGGITRYTIKDGAGTLTLGGDVSNNRYGLTVNAGDVILAKTAGEAVNRFPLTINNAASTVTLTNTGEQIGNQTDINGRHQINEGTLDLNGFDDSLGALITSNGTEPGGVVTNSNSGTTSTLTLLGSFYVFNPDMLDPAPAAEDQPATWPGTLSGDLNLVKSGGFTQTFTGTLSYSGDTTVNGGTLSLGKINSNNEASTVTIGPGGILDLAFTGTDIVDKLFIDGVQQPAGDYTSADPSGAITGGGTLQVTTGPSANDYDDWATGFSLVGGPTDDDDNDGISNEDEYAFGLNPTSGSSVNPITQQLDQATGVFKYTRRNSTVFSTGLTYSYEYSTSLTGSWTPFTPTSETSDDGDPTETITVTVPASLLTEPKLFVRTTTD
jgi:autotransporter-associated beta strand protein